ncbi:MAG: xdh [Myxococcaceae bacterium]|nr:xdh [Myxococcaceae bacterium]
MPSDQTARESTHEVACAVLAAGGSTRMGRPKQLLELDGQPLIRQVVSIACASRCARVAVVLGADAKTIAAAIGPTCAVVLKNHRWAEGMATSLHTAVRWARESAAQALLVTACDQPHLTVQHLDALLDTYHREQRSVASAYGDTLGIPAVLASSAFDPLLAIEGDRGAASVLRRDPNVARVAWPEGAIDLDTPLDLLRFLARPSDGPRSAD